MDDIEIVQIVDKNILTDRSVMIIKVDVGAMPPHRAYEYMDKVKKMFEEKFGTTEIMVVPRSLEIFIVDKEEKNDKNTILSKKSTPVRK